MSVATGVDARGGVAVCSRAGCRAEALWQVVWRNPRIHDASRRKIWAACAEHVDYLREYLASRAFPVEVVAMPDAAPDDRANALPDATVKADS